MEENIKPWYKKWWGIIIILILTLFFVFLAALGFSTYNIIKSGEVNNSLPITNEIDSEIIKKIKGNDNYWIGSAEPKVTIVEFSDFACPFCKNSYPKIREISIKYKDKVKIIYRDYPLHEESVNLALAARCAGEQGLFWLMHDKLFQNQGIKKTEELTDLANKIGVDINKFSECMKNEKYLPQIRKDFSDAEDLKISGTPTWFINGYIIEGDIPYNSFIEIIDNFLKE